MAAKTVQNVQGIARRRAMAAPLAGRRREGPRRQERGPQRPPAALSGGRRHQWEPPSGSAASRELGSTRDPTRKEGRAVGRACPVWRRLGDGLSSPAGASFCWRRHFLQHRCLAPLVSSTLSQRSLLPLVLALLLRSTPSPAADAIAPRAGPPRTGRPPSCLRPLPRGGVSPRQEEHRFGSIRGPLPFSCRRLGPPKARRPSAAGEQVAAGMAAAKAE